MSEISSLTVISVFKAKEGNSSVNLSKLNSISDKHLISVMFLVQLNNKWKGTVCISGFVKRLDINLIDAIFAVQQNLPLLRLEKVIEVRLPKAITILSGSSF